LEKKKRAGDPLFTRALPSPLFLQPNHRVGSIRTRERWLVVLGVEKDCTHAHIHTHTPHHTPPACSLGMGESGVRKAQTLSTSPVIPERGARGAWESRFKGGKANLATPPPAPRGVGMPSVCSRAPEGALRAPGERPYGAPAAHPGSCRPRPGSGGGQP